MSDLQEPLIIKDWDQAIADSPHKGFGMFRNADLESQPGVVKVNKKPGPYFHTITEQTFTANESTDVCTTPANVEENAETFTGAAVYFTTTDTLPAGLSEDTIYFLIRTGNTTFKVATSYQNSKGSSAGTNIDITDSGTGVHTIHQVEIGTVNWIIEDPRTNKVFMLSSTGRVWFETSQKMYLLHNSAIDTGSSDVTASNGKGIAITPFSSTTETFLFVFRNASIDVINVFDITAIEALSWSNAWKTMNSLITSRNSHQAISAQDGAIYFCDTKYIGSIIETVGSTFDPTDAGTYTFNSSALDLPPYEIAECLEELGTDLLIGGDTFNKVYPWDRISDSFNVPLTVPEYSIKKLKNIGGTVYILAGTWGNIYTTQGTYTRHFKKLPEYLTYNTASPLKSNPITWGGVSDVNGSLIFGVGTTTSGNSGVWKLYPDGRLTIHGIPSTGSKNVTAIWAKDDFYYMGYNGGADSFNSELYGLKLYDNYETVIHSPLYEVGTYKNKATYSRMETVLSKPPGTGTNIRIGYRDDTVSSFTTIDTHIGDGSTTIFESDSIGLTDLDNIMFQIELSDTDSGYDIELLEIRLFP